MSINITIDDTHPQIDFHGNWSGWRPAQMDPGTPYNFRQTFHTIWNENHWMNYTFNGSAISVYGTKWLNHGAYSVDGGVEETFEGYERNRLYNSLLYYSGELDMGSHEIRIFNRPSRTTVKEQDPTKNRDGRLWFDVDYMVVEVPIPEGANVTTTIIDDSDSRITYSPQWRARPNSEQGYFNTTAHETNNANAGFALPFFGSSIQLFGTIGTDVGNYTVSVDGKEYSRELNGTWYERRTNSPLFMASGLSDGPHELALTNLGRGPERSNFEFDYAVVNSTSSSGGSMRAPDGSVDNVEGAATSMSPGSGSGSGLGTGGGSGQAQGGSGSGSGSSTPPGAIIGGVVGGIAALALLILLFLCLRRRRRREQHIGDGVGSEHSSEVKGVHTPEIRVGGRAPGLTGNEVHPFHLPQRSPTTAENHPSPLAAGQPGSPTTSNGTGMAMAGYGDTSLRTPGLSSTSGVGAGSGYPSEKRGFQNVQGRSEGSSSAYSPASEGHHPSFNVIMGGPTGARGYGVNGGNGPTRIPPVPAVPALPQHLQPNDPNYGNPYYSDSGNGNGNGNHPMDLGAPLAPQRSNSTGYLSTGTAGNMASASFDAVAGDGLGNGSRGEDRRDSTGRAGSATASATATNHETAPSRAGSPEAQGNAPPPGYAESMGTSVGSGGAASARR